MTDLYLTTEELKARGWTLGIIQALLGAHDHKCWINKLGHQMSQPSKLYLEKRVVQLEASEAFVCAAERARIHQVQMRKAAQTRQALASQAVARYEALCLPAVHPIRVEESSANQKELWQLHLRDFYRWQRQQDHLLSGMSQTVRRTAVHRLLQRYRSAVYQAYGWRE
jgi:hypothetical protein